MFQLFCFQTEDTTKYYNLDIVNYIFQQAN